MDEILRRFWQDLIGRSTGPMHLRLILQPAMATFFAIRAGLADARQGRPAFFWSALTDPARRRELSREGWKDIGKVFMIAVVLDSIYQLIVHRGVYLGEVVVVATVLAIVPYILLRGPINRIARRLPRDRKAASERDRAA